MIELKRYMVHLLVPVGTIGILAVLWSISALVRRYRFNRQQRGEMPGRGEVQCRAQTCLLLLNRYNRHLIFYKISVFVVPVVIVAIYLASRYYGLATGHLIELASLVVLGSLLMMYIGFRMIKMIDARNLTRLIHESRMETRRVLDQMLEKEYIVFHDVISDQFSIDHLVAGPKGVFAIQTHAQPLPSNKQETEDFIVTYNGRELFFPKGSDHGTVENARQNADNLSHWLSGQVNEPIAVRAIVSFPGWTVKRTSSEGIPVINPKQFDSLFKHIQPWQVSDSAIDNIARNLGASQAS